MAAEEVTGISFASFFGRRAGTGCGGRGGQNLEAVKCYSGALLWQHWDTYSRDHLGSYGLEIGDGGIWVAVAEKKEDQATGGRVDVFTIEGRNPGHLDMDGEPKIQTFEGYLIISDAGGLWSFQPFH